MEYTISKQFYDFASFHGFSLKKLFRKARIPYISFQNELLLSETDYYRFFQAFDEFFPDDVLLDMANVERQKKYFPYIFASLSAKNGLDAIYRFVKFDKILNPLDFHLTQVNKTLQIHLSYQNPKIKMPRYALLDGQLVIVSLLRKGSRQNVKPLKVSSDYVYGKKIIDYLGVKPKKEVNNNLIFSLSDVKKKFKTRNDSMWQYLKPGLINRLNLFKSKNLFTNIVREKLFSAIPSNRFSLSDISCSLELHPRTLQRKLSKEHTTYFAQVRFVRILLSKYYLKKPTMKLLTVAYLLGFENLSVFSKAFKKWTGQTISTYKKTVE